MLTIATYNVLAHSYLNPEWYPGVLAEDLDWEVRRDRLTHKLRELDADILALQEVEAFAHLEEALPHYESHWHQKGAAKPDGCALFYRKPLLFEEALYYDDQHKGKPSGHLAQIAGFQVDDLRLGIANTHIKWDPPDTPVDERVSMRQVSQLLAALPTYPADAWILLGDFNAQPGTPLIHALQDAQFTSIFDPQNPSTFLLNGQAQQIDYIFLSPQLRGRALPTPPITPMPSRTQPSDHLPLLAHITPR